MIGEEVGVFGRTLDDSAGLDGVTAGEGESILFEGDESDTGDTFVQWVYCG